MEITFRNLLVEFNSDRFSSSIESLSEGIPSNFWPDVIDDAQSAYLIRKCVDVASEKDSVSTAYIQGLKNILSSEGPLISKAAWPVAAYELIEVIRDIAEKAGTTFDIDVNDYAIHDYTVRANEHRSTWLHIGLREQPNPLIDVIYSGNENQLKAVSAFISSAINGCYVMQGQRVELKVKGLESIERAIFDASKKHPLPILSSWVNQIRIKRREMKREYSTYSVQG